MLGALCTCGARPLASTSRAVFGAPAGAARLFASSATRARSATTEDGLPFGAAKPILPPHFRIRERCMRALPLYELDAAGAVVKDERGKSVVALHSPSFVPPGRPKSELNRTNARAANGRGKTARLHGALAVRVRPSGTQPADPTRRRSGDPCGATNLISSASSTCARPGTALAHYDWAFVTRSKHKMATLVRRLDSTRDDGRSHGSPLTAGWLACPSLGLRALVRPTRSGSHGLKGIARRMGCVSRLLAVVPARRRSPVRRHRPRCSCLADTARTHRGLRSIDHRVASWPGASHRVPTLTRHLRGTSTHGRRGATAAARSAFCATLRLC